MAVPPGAVPGLLDPQQRSGWQLAQQVWQDSGVAWELTETEASGAAFLGVGLAETESAGLRPANVESADAWFDNADPADPERADPEWADSEPLDPEWVDPEPVDPEPVDPEWVDPEPLDPEWVDPEPADPEPVDPESVDPAPAPAAAADNWFDAPGSADARLAARRSMGDRPTVVELTGAYFADSGGIGVEPQFPSTALPRQPTFTPVDHSRLPLPDRVQQGPARDDGEQQERIHFGSAQAAPSRRPGPGWSEYPASGFPGQAWPVGSGQVPLGAPVMAGLQAPNDVDASGLADAAAPSRGGAALPLGEPDELFRAWQGSVREAAAPRRPWPASRPGTSSRRRRALQVATIGVPAVVIVTVGAGALLILTGKANDMLVPRSNTGVVSPAGPAAKASGPSAKGAAPALAGAHLAGYPGQRGPVSVASMQLAGGVDLAVGTADGHPAIWRRAASGSWALESAATLGAVAGRAGLASVAYGPAGWVAVGNAAVGGTTQPLVLASADGVTWQPTANLEDLAGQGAQFLGIAAGHGGYVVVGRQMTGGRTFAILWYSADLRNWTMGGNGGLDGRLTASTANAVAATTGGFVAVGSHGANQAIWTSPDGTHWNLINMNVPAGTSSATLGTVAANGNRVVAAGYADTPAGDIPLVMVSADGGAQWQQIVLPAPEGLGVITALTATPDGFTAAGLAGRHGSVHTVTWTSQDGLTWSQPTQTADSEITALAAAGPRVVGTAEQGTTPVVVPAPAP